MWYGLWHYIPLSLSSLSSCVYLKSIDLTRGTHSCNTETGGTEAVIDCTPAFISVVCIRPVNWKASVHWFGERRQRTMHRVRCNFKIILLDFCVSVWINRVLTGAAYLHSGLLLNKTKSVQPPEAFSAHLPVMVLFWRSVSFVYFSFPPFVCFPASFTPHLCSVCYHPLLSPCFPLSLCEFICSVLPFRSCWSLSHLPVVCSRHLDSMRYFWLLLCFAGCLVFLFCYLPFAATFLDSVFLVYELSFVSRDGGDGDGDSITASACKMLTQTERNIKLQ